MKLVLVLLATLMCASSVMAISIDKVQSQIQAQTLNSNSDAAATERMLEQQVLVALKDSLVKANEVRQKLAGEAFDRIRTISEKIHQLHNHFAKALNKPEAPGASGGPASSNPSGTAAAPIQGQLSTISGNLEGVHGNIMRFVAAAEAGNQANLRIVGKLNVITSIMSLGEINLDLIKLRNMVQVMRQTESDAPRPPIRMICFTESTPITMADGSARMITEVRVGDEVEGGTVVGVMQFSAAGVNIFDYKGVQVAEGHKVLENGQFLPVEQTHHGKLMLGLNPRFIYNLDTTGHRLSIRNMTFADFEEVPLSRRVDSIKLEKLNQ